MKTKLTLKLFCFCILHSAFCLGLRAQGTAFTYQGRLNDGGNPASGIYDLRFTLYDSTNNPGVVVAGPFTNAATGVSNGLFTVTLDFGAAPFNGADLWLEIGVRTNNNGTFATLSPRQKMTPSPYAIYAAGASAAGISGTIPTANLSGTYGSPVTFSNPANGFSGDGTGLANVNAATLGGLGAANFWFVGGNAGTLGAGLGTVDNQPLRLISWNSRVLQLESRSLSLGLFETLIAVNTLGGAARNVISNGVMGGTIAGGGAETNFLFSSVAAPNMVLDNFGTVGGGINNTAGYPSIDFDDARAATVAGGEGNTAQGAYTTVSGGWLNTASGNFFTTVGGGVLNSASGDYATVGGGGYNVGSGDAATVPGGLGNHATATASFAAGVYAHATNDGTFVWSDFDPSGNPYFSTGTNQFCVRARGGVQMEPQTSMYFGSQTRQMLNLYNNTFGIGIQSSTLYFRCQNTVSTDGFIWYKGGVHNDNYVSAGGAGGGVELMHLVSSGLYVNGSIVLTSDRNVKENFAPVQPRDVLEKVAALPITSWNYKQDTTTRHVGPMAQDFYAAFNVGPDDKHIATVDESGVALAAIQGLNEKVEVSSQKAEVRSRKLERKLEQKETEITELRQRLEALETIIRNQKSN